MDPLSLTLSIVGVARAGYQTSLALISLAHTVAGATKSIKRIGDDIYVTCGILNQIKALMEPKTDPQGVTVCIFSVEGLNQIKVSTDSCEGIFKEIESKLAKASKQISEQRSVNGKVVLSALEKAKWPFAKPNVQELRLELKESKINLLLILSVSTIANAEALSLEHRPSSLLPGERECLEATVISLQKEVLSLKHSRSERTKPQTRQVSKKATHEDLKPGRTLNDLAPEIGLDEKDSNDVIQNIEPETMNIASNDAPKNAEMVSRDALEIPKVQIEAPSYNQTAEAAYNGSELKKEHGNGSSKQKEGLKGKWRQLLKGHGDRKSKESAASILAKPSAFSTESSHNTETYPILVNELQAWTIQVITIDDEDYDLNLGYACKIVPLPLPESELLEHVRKFQKKSLTVMDRLERLNTNQQAMIIQHARLNALQLIFVEAFRRRKLPSALGDLDITVLVWITTPERIKIVKEPTQLYHLGQGHPSPPNLPPPPIPQQHHQKDGAPYQGREATHSDWSQSQYLCSASRELAAYSEDSSVVTSSSPRVDEGSHIITKISPDTDGINGYEVVSITEAAPNVLHELLAKWTTVYNQ